MKNIAILLFSIMFDGRKTDCNRINSIIKQMIMLPSRRPNNIPSERSKPFSIGSSKIIPTTFPIIFIIR